MRSKFNVLIWNFNTQTIEEYNVIPYFVREWEEEKDKSKFKSFDDIKEFVRSKSLYQFWSRCEYEMIVKGWPVTKREIKLDVHEQIMMNLDLVTQVFINTIGWKVKDILLLLEQNGWSDLIDSRWEQQVREEILTAYPDIDIDTLNKVLEIVLI